LIHVISFLSGSVIFGLYYIFNKNISIDSSYVLIKDRSSSTPKKALKIQRTLGLLHGLAWKAMGVDHRGSKVIMAE
jgi:hypothetical protein